MGLKPRTILAGALALLLMSACATQTPYVPAEESEYGFADQRIEPGRYRVSFRGNSSTPRGDVETYLLRRMAELTLRDGFDHFVVIEHDTECDTTYWTSETEGCSYHRPRGRFDYYAIGYDCRPTSRTYESKEYEAFAFISMHEGEKPEDNPQAFDAASVLENVGD